MCIRDRLYKALNVPAGRLDSGTAFNLGRSSEITRDELKFTKFVGKLRKKFGDLFNDSLKTQLILKSVITPEDWEDMKEHIQYDYLKDNHFTELKNLEMKTCLLYTSPSPRDGLLSRMPSSA